MSLRNGHTIQLRPGQTPSFTWAESNANEGEQRIFLICIPFGSCEIQRLIPALANGTSQCDTTNSLTPLLYSP